MCEPSPAFLRRWTLGEWKASPTKTHMHFYSELLLFKFKRLQGLCLCTVWLLVLWSPPLCVEWLWPPPVLQSCWSHLQSTRGVCRWIFQHKGAGRRSVIQSYLLLLCLQISVQYLCSIQCVIFFSLTYLSCGGLAFVEIIVVWRVWGVKSWLKEDTAQGYCFNGSWTLVGEPKT